MLLHTFSPNIQQGSEIKKHFEMRWMSAPLSMKENVCKISVFEINIKLSVLFFVVECCLIQRNTQFKRKYFGMEQFNDKCISTGWRFSHLFFRFHFLQHFSFFSPWLGKQFRHNNINFFFFQLCTQRWARATEYNGLWFDEEAIICWIWWPNSALTKRWFSRQKFSRVNLKQNRAADEPNPWEFNH